MRPENISDEAIVATVTGEFAPPPAMLRDAADARAYRRSTFGYVCLLYALLALALASLIPAWVLVPAVPLIYLRLALALHELVHACPPAQVSWLHRLTMIFESPVCLGYREHRAIHFAHHRFASTDRDPERYQIVGGASMAFLNAMISPERGFIRWVREHGLSRPLAIETTIRFMAFAAVLAINPRVFLTYWMALRMSVGFASFVFHYALHNDDGRLGTFPLPAPAWLIRTARVLFGAEPMLILTEHERHHAWPRVRARDLPLLPEPRS